MPKLLVLVLFLISLLFPKYTVASYSPTSVPNNNFGLHIMQEADLEKAASIINSSGGDWGYVTLVIRKDERDFRRWQNAFNKMRKLHLIPIVRIATIHQNGGWEEPNPYELSSWIDFLASLNWPTQNMYVVVGNEPNHSQEWGGEISPEEYADYLFRFLNEAHAKSADFFILPAALDFSADSNGKSLDATNYLRRMHLAQPTLFSNIDGWNSHSYPNPNFSGSETATGKGTISSYLWELNYLKNMGVDKNLPVFITETGWAHSIEGESSDYLEPDVLGEKFEYAFKNVWSNPNIVAVTPFIYKYEEAPFNVFSWEKKDGSSYPFVEIIKALKKQAGQPTQKNTGEILSVFVPPFVPDSENFSGALFVKNTGQKIWDESNLPLLRDIDNNIEITKFISFPTVEPEAKRVVLFEAKSANQNKSVAGNLTFYEKGTMITNAKAYSIRMYSPELISEKYYSIRNAIASSFWILKIRFLNR